MTKEELIEIIKHKSPEEAADEILKLSFNLLVSSRHNLVKSMLEEMNNVHSEYHHEIVAEYLNDGC